MMTTPLSRRSALRTLAGSAALLSATGLAPALSSAVAAEAEKAKLKGNIKHSVSRWCYGKISLEDLCQAGAKMGIESVELLGEKEWPVVKQFGLTCAMCNGPDNIGYGFNRVEHHDKLVQGFTDILPKIAQLGFPNVICFSGNRGGMSD